MTQREAKRRACRIAAQMIEAAMFSTDPDPLYPEDCDPADAERITEAYRSLIDELHERGREPQTARRGER